MKGRKILRNTALVIRKSFEALLTIVFIIWIACLPILVFLVPVAIYYEIIGFHEWSTTIQGWIPKLGFTFFVLGIPMFALGGTGSGGGACEHHS